MQVSKINSPSWLNSHLQIRERVNVQNTSNPIPNYGLKTDTVSFSEKKVIENVFIDDLKYARFQDYPQYS